MITKYCNYCNKIMIIIQAPKGWLCKNCNNFIKYEDVEYGKLNLQPKKEK